jgi:hypothetical protein
MIRSRFGLKALCLCGLVAGLVVLGANAVQAEETAHWNVNGASVSATLKPEVVIAEVEKSDITLATKVAGIAAEFLCTGAQFIGAKLEPEGKVSSGNKTKFTGCITKLNGVVSAACVPNNNGTEKGVAVSTALKGLLILNKGEGIILFEPVSGTTFLNLEFSEECSIGEVCPIIGNQSVKDRNGQLGVELVTHSVEQGPISELWVVSKTAEHVATVTGSAVLKLGGSHAGLKWSGTPG